MIDVDKILQDSNLTFPVSREQKDVLLSLCARMVRHEWGVKVIPQGRGTYSFHLTLGLERMIVRVTGSGTITLARWQRQSLPYSQTWSPAPSDVDRRKDGEDRWKDGEFTFGWDRPTPKDIGEFCRMWIDKIDAGTDELPVLRQHLAQSMDAISDGNHRVRQLQAKLSEVQEQLDEENERFNRLTARIEEIKADRKGRRTSDGSTFRTGTK